MSRTRLSAAAFAAEPSFVSKQMTPYTLSGIVTPSDETVLWRYLDLEKLLALLESRTLFLCRLDKFRDKWEGTWPDTFLNSLVSRIPEERAKQFLSTSDALRSVHFVSCWHASKYESAALWDQYSRGSGVALRSSVGRLRGAVTGSYRFIIGEVEYIDFAAELPAKLHPVIPVFRKRKSFEHEREVRLLVSNMKLNGDDVDWNDPFDAIHLGVNIGMLVESVFVSPEAPKWLVAAIAGVLRAFDHGAIPVNASELYDARVK